MRVREGGNKTGVSERRKGGVKGDGWSGWCEENDGQVTMTHIPGGLQGEKRMRNNACHPSTSQKRLTRLRGSADVTGD